MKDVLDKDTLIEVSNRCCGSVTYIIKDLNGLQRTFFNGQSRQVPMEELRMLSYQPGGMSLLKNYLKINNEAAVKELLGETEPEYNYTEEDVKDILLNGTLDELKDCLDFAPKGIIDLIQSYAVKCKINDIQKRDAIKEITGFDVTSAISIMDEVEKDEPETDGKTRRAAPSNNEEEQKPVRRVPSYKVVK